MDTISSRLHRARELSGLTLAQIAEKTGYAVATLSGVENGHDRPSKRLFLKWLTVLNLNRRWVDTGQGEMFAATNNAKQAVEPDLAASLHFHIQAARRHAKAALEELHLLEHEISTRTKTPKIQRKPRG